MQEDKQTCRASTQHSYYHRNHMTCSHLAPALLFGYWVAIFSSHYTKIHITTCSPNVTASFANICVRGQNNDRYRDRMTKLGWKRFPRLKSTWCQHHGESFKRKRANAFRDRNHRRRVEFSETVLRKSEDVFMFRHEITKSGDCIVEVMTLLPLKFKFYFILFHNSK